MVLSESVIDWVQAQLGVAVGSGIKLPGATTAEVIAFQAGNSGYVLKLFSNAAFVEEHPDRAVHEGSILEQLEMVNIPTPRLIAVDGDGAECGNPAVLMSRLPGERGVGKDHADEMVEIATRLHAAELKPPWEFQRYNHGFELEPPRWGTDAGLWDEALAVVIENGPSEEWGFIHRDFNSTNFLVSGDSITGVVDWLSACVGPFGIDAARLRLDLTIDGRTAVADAVTRAFHRTAPGVVHSHWDLVDAVDLLPIYEGVEALDRWGNPAKRQRLEGFMSEAIRGM